MTSRRDAVVEAAAPPGPPRVHEGGPRRLEDWDLLRGGGLYVDDIRLPGMLHAAILRSPVAHAALRRVDVTAALRWPGIVAALAFADLPRETPALPNLRPHPALRARTAFPLARDRVRYVGEPIAVVVGTSRYVAEDALDCVKVEYEALPVVTGLGAAAEGRPALVHEDLGSNVAARIRQETGDVAAAFARADLVLHDSFHISRSTGQAMETRGVVAAVDRDSGVLTVWASCQRPHQNRRHIAAMLGLPEERVRVIAPHVGGGFGPKGRFYAEDYLIPHLARTLGHPVKWIEDRREHLLTTTQEREQVHQVSVALGRDGTVLGVRDSFVQDMGAYVSAGLVVPFNTLSLLPGPYRVPAVEVEATCLYTNRVATSPVRGAGQPEATFVMEHIMDLAAAALRLDPAEVRRRNLIVPEAMPYAGGLRDMDGQPIVYDSGDYPRCLARALEAIGYASARRDQERLRGQGVYRGIGLGCYVELTGVGPQEEAVVRVDRGGVRVIVGCGSQGQGHRTILAQVAAAELGLHADDVSVVEGDTGLAGASMGTFGSRTAVVAGTAVLHAAHALRAKLLDEAAGRLKVSSAEVTLAGGRAYLTEDPGTRVSFSGLEARATFAPSSPTVSSGVHAVIVEVTPESGEVVILRYVIVHDCGRMLNPSFVEGQVLGGFAHGLGETLYERLVYDGDGQLLTTTFVDYLLPTAAEVPEVVLEHIEVPSPLNALGAKGAGEGGVIPVQAAVSLAVQDALRPFGIAVNRVPLAPDMLWRAEAGR